MPAETTKMMIDAAAIIPIFSGKAEELDPFLLQVDYFATDIPAAASHTPLLNVVYTKLRGDALKRLNDIRAEKWPEVRLKMEKLFQPEKNIGAIFKEIETLHQGYSESFEEYKTRATKIYESVRDIPGQEGNDSYVSTHLRKHFLGGLRNHTLISAGKSQRDKSFMDLLEWLQKECEEEEELQDIHRRTKPENSPNSPHRKNYNNMNNNTQGVAYLNNNFRRNNNNNYQNRGHNPQANNQNQSYQNNYQNNGSSNNYRNNGTVIVSGGTIPILDHRITITEEMAKIMALTEMITAKSIEDKDKVDIKVSKITNNNSRKPEQIFIANYQDEAILSNSESEDEYFEDDYTSEYLESSDDHGENNSSYFNSLKPEIGSADNGDEDYFEISSANEEEPITEPDNEFKMEDLDSNQDYSLLENKGITQARGGERKSIEDKDKVDIKVSKITNNNSRKPEQIFIANYQDEAILSNSESEDEYFEDDYTSEYLESSDDHGENNSSYFNSLKPEIGSADNGDEDYFEISSANEEEPITEPDNEFKMEDLDSNQDYSLLENKGITQARGGERVKKVLDSLKLQHLEKIHFLKWKI
ncbi:exonuclease 1-like [Wyeomyia smithii]|uniref:exonuclease 1-like n=1 Tax=Wyeomyia smithii TaxID=174621 RepID=UPI002467E27F|nr:exonuclease 1-like [Wyeomyia smithii]